MSKSNTSLFQNFFGLHEPGAPFMRDRQGTHGWGECRKACSFVICAALASALIGSPSSAHAQAPATEHWVGTWATSVQIPEPQNSLTPADMTDSTIRQIVHLSIGGSTVRVHLSNAFGTRPLHLFSVHIARSADLATSRIDPATDTALTFNGAPDVIIPPAAQYISDPIAFPAAALSDVAITIHFDQPPTPETGHPGSRATTYIINGDHVSDAEFPGPMTAAQTPPTPRRQFPRPPSASPVSPAQTGASTAPPTANATPAPAPSAAQGIGDGLVNSSADELAQRLAAVGTRTIEHWYTISGIDVIAPAKDFAVIALGDSITDGHATTTNGNNRWTDALNNKLQSSPATRHIAVLNHGIGGNHLLTDGLGPNVLARFDRDVLAQASARYVVVFEAVNDLGGRFSSPEQHAALVARIIGAYQQIIARAHAAGLTVIGATITPDGGSQYNRTGAAGDADRLAVNDWIKAPGHFDSVIDFATLIADPADPSRMAPAYDSGDHLHPGVAGYKVMGELFTPSMFGVRGTSAKAKATKK
jgi:lysophospholipase L1-like esterase